MTNSYVDKSEGFLSVAAANHFPGRQKNGEPAFQLADNRPDTIAQRTLQELANHYSAAQTGYAAAGQQPVQLFSPGSEAVAQQVIDYTKRGKWSTREKLVNEIVNYFKATEEERKIIENAVIEAEQDKKENGAWHPELFYKAYIFDAAEKGILKHPFEKVEKNNQHGPQLPVDKNVKKPKKSVEHSSENTFTFPNKTMGNAQVICGDKVVFECIKYSDNGVHAEKQMINDINSWFGQNEYKWSQLKVRITINNFPCNEKGHQCGLLLSLWGQEKQMKEIHIYYANKYDGSGKTGFLDSWKHMKSCNIPINLTPFKAEEFLQENEFGVRAIGKFKPVVPEGKNPDPFSEDEEEMIIEKSDKKGKKNNIVEEIEWYEDNDSIMKEAKGSDKKSKIEKIEIDHDWNNEILFFDDKSEEDIMSDWPEQTALQVDVRKINNAGDLKLAARQIALKIEAALDIEPKLEMLTSDFLSYTISAYKKLVNLNQPLTDVLEYLVAEYIYNEDHSEALKELKQVDKHYREIIQDLGR